MPRRPHASRSPVGSGWLALLLGVALASACGEAPPPEPSWRTGTRVLMQADGPARLADARSLGAAPAPRFRLDGPSLDEGRLQVWFRLQPGTRPGSRMLACLPAATSLDADPHPDLLVGEAPRAADDVPSRIYFGGPEGLETTAPLRLASRVPRGMALGDLDGDGHRDLVVAMNAADTLPHPVTPEVPGEVHVFRGPFAGGGRRGTPDLVLEVDLPQGLALLEFDDHPGLDLVVGSFHPDSPPLAGFSGDGSGGFRPMPFAFGEHFGSSAEALAVGDVDRDGVLDVVYASLDALPSLLLRGERDAETGDYTLGGFEGEGSPLSPRALGVSMADLDADGWLDVVLARTLEDELAIHFNDGRGGFPRRPDLVVPSPRPFTVTAERDLDHDGHLDLVTANWRAGRAGTPVSRAHLGPFNRPASGGQDGPVVHTGPERHFAVEDAVSLTVGDIDGDGWEDVAFHSSSAPDLPVFLLDAAGRSRAGRADGVEQPSFVLPARPTRGQPAGEGVAVWVTGGTMPYGPSGSPSHGIELLLDADDAVRSVLTTDDGRRHHLVHAFERTGLAAGEQPHLVEVTWSAAEGLFSLRLHTASGHVHDAGLDLGPYALRLGPLFHLGADATGQRRPPDGTIEAARLDDRAASTDG